MKSRHNAHINKNVIFLGIASFFNDFSSEIIKPILPLFIQSFGGGGLIIGLIGGLRDSFTYILEVIGGFLSDKLGKRKIFPILGYSISSFFKLLLSFSKHLFLIIPFASLERIGKGIRQAPRDAIVADSMKNSKGKGFGIHRALDNLGGFLGAFLVLYLIIFLNLGFQNIFLISALICIVSLIPLFFIKEPKIQANKELKLKLTYKKLPDNLRTFILIVSLFSLSDFNFMFFIYRINKLSQIHPLLMGIIFYIIFSFTYAISCYPLGILSDRIDRKKLIFIGYAIFSIICLSFIKFKALPSLVFIFFLYGIFKALRETSEVAFVSDISPSGIKATALGTFQMMKGIASLPGSIMAGILWKFLGYDWTFFYGGVVAILSLVMYEIYRARLE